MQVLIKTFIWIFLFLLISLTSCNEAPVEPGLLAFNWQTSTPEKQGMDSQMLEEAFVQGENRGFVDCIMVIRNGYIVAERYYNGYNKNAAHNVKSVSKSFLSAMTGIALRDGYLRSLNVRMLDFFPEYVTSSIDPRKHNITVKHLLMMRGGIENDRSLYDYIYHSANWIETTIQLPLIYDPGTTFSYNTFLTHLLSVIITRSSGMNTKDFAQVNLLDKMDIICADWKQGPQGYYFGGNNMYFTPRNMARLGYLYLNNGKLNSEQIVPQDWIDASLTNFTNWSNSNWGDLDDVQYGYLWWLGKINNQEVFLAIGHGGQFVICFPDLNMIVVTTSNNHVDMDKADQQERAVVSIVADYIVPAVNQ